MEWWEMRSEFQHSNTPILHFPGIRLLYPIAPLGLDLPYPFWG